VTARSAAPADPSAGALAATPGLAPVPAIAAPLTAAQRAFNALVGRIEAERARLAAWEAALPDYHRRWHADLQPRLDARRRAAAEFARFLDGAYGWPGLSNADRRLLAEAIRATAQPLVGTAADRAGDGAGHDADTAALRGLLDKYADPADAARRPARRRDADASADAPADGGAAGTDGDDDPSLSPEALAVRIDARLEADRARAEAAREAGRAARRRAAGQRRAAGEARQAGQSARDVYRRLASALHPDREPDAAERARKTVLMQRANEAHAAGRLLDLLQLQLEAELTDPSRIAALGEARLETYNRLLAAQLADVERENRETAARIAGELGLGPQDALSPGRIPGRFRELLQWLDAEQQARVRERRALVDAAALRQWLRARRQAVRHADDGDGGDA
jgi:hypothetical protein